MDDTDDTGLDFDTLAQDVGVQVNLTRRALWMKPSELTLFRDGRHPSGLISVFIMIGANPGVSQKKLADALFLDPGALGDIVDLLETKHLVERRRDPADRRRMSLFATPAGKKEITRLKARTGEKNERLTAAFTPEEVELLIEFLQRLRNQAR
ncbi:MAG: winged helix-turn-helix transcriptional regulator [Sphingomonadales bacterium]|nr:winged helix-turn-helix transcriptional regulator [Sphingomonadales bacterium]